MPHAHLRARAWNREESVDNSLGESSPNESKRDTKNVETTHLWRRDWRIRSCDNDVRERAGCSHTVTFDRRAARLVPSMELLA